MGWCLRQMIWGGPTRDTTQDGLCCLLGGRGFAADAQGELTPALIRRAALESVRKLEPTMLVYRTSGSRSFFPFSETFHKKGDEWQGYFDVLQQETAPPSGQKFLSLKD